MSLINDALKRAKEAQAKATPPEESIPHLRPVEPERTGRSGTGLVTPIALTLVAVGSLFCLWQAGSNNLPVQAANAAPRAAGPVATCSTTPPAVAEDQGRGGTRPCQEGLPAVGASTAPARAAITVVTNGPISAAAATTVATNLATPPVPAVAPPAPPRLQAIVFNPAHPSAMINGKTVFVGDHIGELQVAAITRDSATLVGRGGTNFLSLER